MKHKIFISINLPERTKKRLIEALKAWQSLPVKWIKEDNLHITLSFLGFIDDALLADICEKVQKVAKNSEIFDLNFSQIELGPTLTDPKMFWLTGEASKELKILQENLEKALGIFVSRKKIFRPHITLGKIRKHKWEALEKIPEIFTKFPIMIPVESVDVMASDFSGEGPEYTIIESCPLS